MRQLTHGPRHHFFGRPGISPWNRSGSRIACLESDFHGRAPARGDRASVGIVDPNTGGFTAVATTTAFNFTKGAMLAWCPTSPDEELLFNDVVDGSLVGIRLNVRSGARHFFMRPFAAAGGQGSRAASLNYPRIERLHPGEGFAVGHDATADEPAPETDGLFVIDLSTKLARLVISQASIAIDAASRKPALRKREFWIEQVSFNPGGSRLLFTAFAGGSGAGTEGALFTIGIDGSDFREVVPFGMGVTRGAWLDAKSGVATFRDTKGSMMPRIFSDGAQSCEPLDTGSPTGMVTVTPAPGGNIFAIESEDLRRRVKQLSVFNRDLQLVTDVARMQIRNDTLFQGPGRCDFNPRWHRDGGVVCVDAIGAEGTRQLHLIQVAGKISKSG